MPYAQDDKKDRLIIGACNVDANIRSIAIRDIVAYLEENGQKTEEDELVTMQSKLILHLLIIDGRLSQAPLQATLRTRILDSDTAVLDSLYRKPNVILPIVSTKAFLLEFADALSKQDLSRSALRLHLTFFLHPFF